MSAVSAVVFDLDNTLCQSDQDTAALYTETFERAGVEPFGEPELLWAALDGPPDPDDRISYLGAGFARLAAKHDRTEVDPISLAAALIETVDHSAVAFRPGAKRALACAREHGPVGILTNGPRDRQELKVEALGLDELVDVIVYAGDFPRRKPHVDPFERMFDRLGTPAAETLYVGDSLEYDVAGAQNAGLPAAWLRNDDTDPGEYRPEYILDSLADLEQLLDDD